MYNTILEIPVTHFRNRDSLFIGLKSYNESMDGFYRPISYNQSTNHCDASIFKGINEKLYRFFTLISYIRKSIRLLLTSKN